MAFLAMQVKDPNKYDCNRIHRMLSYLRNTINLPLTLQVEILSMIHWCLEASLEVHMDFKNHTNRVMKKGNGTVIDIHKEKMINTRR